MKYVRSIDTLRFSNCRVILDAAGVPGSASKARASYSAEISAALAILCKKRSAFASGRGVGRVGRIGSVSLAVLRPISL